ncbi:hypothetical protein DERP_002709 [Dermatophagoides pteronyssinus]|uniref:Uncharacterized protein n=1 Tax=Dermatophagoides pteronyssinus TaxID=6956 RepID=A0ABQ8JW20_DERPT|nr:hypothetical protein DERP_002709 [Dermatophagoides pteronyssinus]
MSFINFSNQQQQQQPSVVSITSTTTNNNSNSSRRGSIHNNNDVSSNNISSGEWTARTETYNSYNDPFGDQINQQQQNDFESQPLIDPFDQNQNHTRTVIRKLGLKRNSQSNSSSTTLDSKFQVYLTSTDQFKLD